LKRKETKLVFVGFGTVGQGCARHLQSHRRQLSDKYGFRFKVIGITDIAKGSVLNDRGIDLSKAISSAKKQVKLENAGLGGSGGLSTVETIAKAKADVVVESTWTNLTDAEPGLSHMVTALRSGSDVVTSNKGPIALHYKKLTDLAKVKRQILRFESTVMSGTPIFTLREFCLPSAKILGMRGILNGTTNYILTEMAKGKDYSNALKNAQTRGYAEVDPTGDVEAHDPAAKITILANALMNRNIRYTDVKSEGITKITAQDISNATADSKTIKLLAQASEVGGKLEVNVKPTLLPDSDMLAHVNGIINALNISTDVQPDLTLVGPGAGGDSAGYGLLCDIIAIHNLRSGWNN